MTLAPQARLVTQTAKRTRINVRHNWRFVPNLRCQITRDVARWHEERARAGRFDAAPLQCPAGHRIQQIERYFTTIESFGATVHHRLLLPATEAELTRLEEFIGVDLPREVRDWYAFANGTDPNHPGTNSTSGKLFPVLAPASVSEAIRLASWYRDYTDQIDPSYTYATRSGIPLLHPLGGDEAMLLADCSLPSTRFVTWSGGEGYRDYAGYYHQSLVDFIDGARSHAEAGRFESISGGVHISDDAHTDDVLLNYGDPRGALRLIYGFDQNDQPVPRLVNS